MEIDLGFRVIVREISSISQIMQQLHHFEAHLQEDIESNQDILGFEDIDEIPEPVMVIGSKDHGMVVGLHEAEQDFEQRTNQKDSNFESRYEEPVCALRADSINSDTRTKTVNSNHNACSLDVIKDSGHLTALGHEWNGNLKRSNEESLLEPPGFEKITKGYNGHAYAHDPALNKEGATG